jgi:tetratricopeptide (TPR) repeat protein
MPKALTHLMQSQRIFLKLESAHKLAALNRSLGKFYVQNHQISLARSAFRTSLRYYESGRIFGIACYVLQEYASTFERSHSDSLFYFLNRSLDLATEKNLEAERASTLVKLGTYFLNIGDLPQAFSHFEVCLKTAQGTDSALYKQEARRGLISCYESEGKWKEAAVLNEEWLFENQLSGGVNNKIKEQLQSLLQAQSYLQESIRSANKIGELRRRQATNNRAFFMVLLGVLLALAITVIFSLLIYIRKREHDALRLKMESDFSGLKGMINQHFMANILNSIKSLVNQGEIETADTYLNKFSALLRGVLNQTKSTLIPLDEELRFIHLYIELEQLRFPGQIEFEVVVDPQLDSKNIFVPAMLLHPILENSIQHGRRGGEIPLKLFLTIFPQAGRLVCMVQDDGIGLEAAQTRNAAGKNFSFGLSLTEQRIKLLGKQLKVQVDLHIEDVLDAQSQSSGTRVVLQIPLTYSSVS